MPAAWKDVAASPAYQALPPDQKEAARQQYFQQVVAPQISDPADLAQAKQQFDSQYGPSRRQAPSHPAQTYDPTEGMSAGEKFAAGMGKSAVDTWRGIEQLGELVASPISSSARNAYQKMKQEQSDSEAQDAPLMNTVGGKLGNIAGLAATSLLGGTALKGLGLAQGILPATYGGAAISGAAQGILQPIDASQTEASRLGNAALGAGGGVVGQGAVNGIGAALRGAKALAAPFMEGGQDQIVANSLRRFGGDAAMSASPSSIPGVKATMAEQTGNSGLASLQNALVNSDPSIAQQFAEQRMGNNASRLGLLQQIAGSDDDLEKAVAARDARANMRYGQAFQDDYSQQIARQYAADQWKAQEALLSLPPGNGLSKAESVTSSSPIMSSLAKRPVIQAASQMAKNIAYNAGLDIGDPMSSLQGQHYIKMALDDMLETGPSNGIGASQQNAIRNARSAFISELERQNPAYKSARNDYRNLSAPVNAIQLGQAIQSRLTSPDAIGRMTDALGNPTLTPAKFAQALVAADKMAKKISPLPGATAQTVLNKGQQSGLSELMNDLSRQNIADNGVKALGSNTAKSLASMNVLGEVARGINLPGLENSHLLGRLIRPIESGYKLFGTDDEIRNKLASIMLNPQSEQAQSILARMTPKDRSAMADYLSSGGGLIGQSTSLSVPEK